ncbi:hypothetical protein LX32DRAFT_657415 [Colletotrichum zoysiae]|uniref:Uncharacterized protein n=1 Tax=Colletotrichum zoysiae TaxID=1216348 RepID=A0AAD9H759_9PEZI|nr:hypothetical protein LX32DRAFT_657415 [Colletotrichum zoysiae]
MVQGRLVALAAIVKAPCRALPEVPVSSAKNEYRSQCFYTRPLKTGTAGTAVYKTACVPSSRHRFGESPRSDGQPRARTTEASARRVPSAVDRPGLAEPADGGGGG